jgi:hypothetical protein
MMTHHSQNASLRAMHDYADDVEHADSESELSPRGTEGVHVAVPHVAFNHGEGANVSRAASMEERYF